jgi:cation diffusion facilitator CzcD-associated flavoprotein CzcO
MSTALKLDHEVIIVGAGVAGIYQIQRLTELGVNATVLEADADLGGTWYTIDIQVHGSIPRVSRTAILFRKRS